jgi:hypothetical protein
MKDYLLTWYGLTDLRAALGLDDTEGPVLSALKTGDYSNVVILAYTNPDKEQLGFDSTLRDEWEKWRTAPSGGQPALSREKVQEFVDAVSNTEAGHEIFRQWLHRELKPLGLQVAIQVLPHSLKQLNDATGIYNAAASAVRVALEDPDDKRVTTYVSPGTPVMAYTWALIARSNPRLHIGVVSSSDPRKPPEQIELPKALLDTSISASARPEAESPEYDLVIHLLGEQTIPVLFGMRQFQTEHNIILTTKEYEAAARRLAKVAGIAPNPVIVPDPFKPADTRKAITKQVNKRPGDAKIAVNMTGGTKLMFAGALSACWELGLDPFYFEIRHHNVIFLRDGTHVPFVGISDIEDFLRAGDFRTASAGRWNSTQEARLPTTQELWRRRDSLRGLYKTREFLTFAHKWDSDRAPFSFSWNGGEASLDQDSATRLVLKDAAIDVPTRGYFQFLSGGWLEEYVYSLLRPLEEQGVIRDVRVGFEVGYREDSTSKAPQRAQEFDCVFTDGKRLWIVECKAGPVRQEAIQKLENNVKLYGGVAARGILISSFPLTEANRHRLKMLPAICAVQAEELSTETLKTIVLNA